MNTKRICPRRVLSLALPLLLWIGAGCKHAPPKSTTPITEVQAPPVKAASQPSADSSERRLQNQIDLLQEQIGILTRRTEALSRFHSSQMGPKWNEKVQAARAESSREAERLRYLEATKALLARKLQALRAEMKVYEEFEASDPAISRP